MIFYSCLLVLLILNMIIFKNNKKYFIVSSFGLLFLVAALRKYTVGIDLNGHYADNYLYFGEIDWKTIIEISRSNNSFYDSGLIIFMRILSSICKNAQFFIISTSAITYGLVGRYIYKHSENVFLETFLFFTTFTYFMYMNIIAQGLALAIILFGVDFLKEKSYIKFAFVVLLANFIHSSAIICLIFIPLNMIKLSKRNLKKVGLIAILSVLFIDRILPIVLKYIYPQFAFYFKSQTRESIDKLQLIHLILYVMCLLIGIIATFGLPIKKQRAIEKNNEYNTNEIENSEKSNSLDSNFLFYMTILSIVFRFLALKLYIFSRTGFYCYLFAYSLLTKSIQKIKNKNLRLQIKLGIYCCMTVFFFVLRNTLKVSYGVLPYTFFWQ